MKRLTGAGIAVPLMLTLALFVNVAARDFSSDDLTVIVVKPGKGFMPLLEEAVNDDDKILAACGPACLESMTFPAPLIAAVKRFDPQSTHSAKKHLELYQLTGALLL